MASIKCPSGKQFKVQACPLLRMEPCMRVCRPDSIWQVDFVGLASNAIHALVHEAMLPSKLKPV